jgi:hypothetical protein
MKILYLIIATILSAFCYRIGGMSKEQANQHFPWFPQVLVKSWFRDVNCTLLALGYVLFLPLVGWWWYFLSAGAMYASITTYWDRFTGKDNFFLHGLFIRLAFLFIAVPLGCWLGCLISAIALSLFMGIWCAIFSNDFIEEYGRGASIIFTLPLMIF